MELPESFYSPDEFGSKGITEWGFMSTTASKETALKYSGANEGLPLATIMVIQANAIDRGACIMDFSQYPMEEEYIWPPCSFMQQAQESSIEISRHGLVKIIPVHVNANLRTQTVEEMQMARKNAHLSSLRFCLDNIKNEVTEFNEFVQQDKSLSKRIFSDTMPLSEFKQGLLCECEKLYNKHSCKNFEHYLNEDTYKESAIEMLDFPQLVQSKLDLWLEDTSWDLRHVHDLSLRHAHRLKMDMLEKTLFRMPADQGKDLALKVCKLKGLVKQSIDEKSDIGECPVLRAAAEGHGLENFVLLKRAGGNMFSRSDPEGKSAIILAAQFGHSHSIDALLSLGADINDKFGCPLLAASSQGQTKCVKLLINRFADVGAVDCDGNTALHVAASCGQTEIVGMLIDARCNVNAKNKRDQTPIALASFSRHQEAIESLLKHGALASEALLAVVPHGDEAVARMEQLFLEKGYNSEERKFISAAFSIGEELLPSNLVMDVNFAYEVGDLVGIRRGKGGITVSKINGKEFCMEYPGLPGVWRTVLLEPSGLSKPFLCASNLFKITVAYTEEQHEVLRSLYKIGQAVDGTQILQGKFMLQTGNLVGVEVGNCCKRVGLVTGSCRNKGIRILCSQFPASSVLFDSDFHLKDPGACSEDEIRDEHEFFIRDYTKIYQLKIPDKF